MLPRLPLAALGMILALSGWVPAAAMEALSERDLAAVQGATASISICRTSRCPGS
jgi:hypothetical protein